jgi:hypothetical protein
VEVNEKLAGSKEDKNATIKDFLMDINSLAIKKTGMIIKEDKNALMIFITGYAAVISPKIYDIDNITGYNGEG